MFKKLFGKPSSDESKATPATEHSPQTEALLRAIQEQSKTDPLVGAKIGAKEVTQRLMGVMKTEKGVHVESVLSALGALAGYACQASLRAQALEKNLPETAAFTVVQAKNGKQYFFGDPLNGAVAESQHSVWGLAAGAAQHAGCQNLPDINDVFRHVSQTIGGDQFGIPRIPDGHRPGDTPINYLKGLWPQLLPLTKMLCPKPVDWPIMYSLALQNVIVMAKEVIDPGLALSVAMESAIPMSKVDLQNP